jgi:O-antigen/teichoic acid export membrane protein
MGVNGIYWAYLLSSGITFVLLLPIAIKHFMPTITKAILVRMLKFGLPFLPSTLAIFVMDSSDRFFIKHFLGLEATGIYGAGYKLALVIKLFISAFQFAWIPFFISIAYDKNAKEIFSKILTYFTLICSLVFLFFSMYMDQVIRLNLFGYTILGKEYWGSTQIVPVVILAYICYGIYLNFLVGIYLKEKTKYLIYITGVGAIINILGNFLFIPSFKLMGAAYATLLSYLSMTIFLYFIAQKYYPIKYEWSKLAKVGLFSAIVFIIFEKISLPYETYAKLILLISYLIFLYYSRFFDSREISKLKMLFKGFHGKISTR